VTLIGKPTRLLSPSTSVPETTPAHVSTVVRLAAAYQSAAVLVEIARRRALVVPFGKAITSDTLGRISESVPRMVLQKPTRAKTAKVRRMSGATTIMILARSRNS